MPDPRMMTLLCLALFASPVSAHQEEAQAAAPALPEIISGAELFAHFGADPASQEITTVEVAPGLHVLYGAGGNVLASVGEQGTLLVDDQFEASVPKLLDAVRAAGGGDPDFVINTHWHFDHADGNPTLAASGSWIVAHAESRRMMQQRNIIDLVGIKVDQPPYPQESLPVISFDDRMRLHFNSHTIELLHFGAAHTTGDIAVLFREAGVVHMGDIYNGGYPFIDADSGGSLEGAIAFCEQVLAEAEGATVFIPGHGRVTDRAAFVDYVEMLRTIHSRLQALIADGASLEEVLDSGITAEWDEARGNPTRLLNRGYFSITSSAD